MRIIGLTLSAVLLLAGCGGEREFEPGEFVDAANGEDAGLVLGEELASIEDGVDVYALGFEAARGSHDHSGGSLIVTADADAARGEHVRCEEAVSLVCYRAANVVLLFDIDPSDENVARVDAALRALETD